MIGLIPKMRAAAAEANLFANGPYRWIIGSAFMAKLEAESLVVQAVIERQGVHVNPWKPQILAGFPSQVSTLNDPNTAVLLDGKGNIKKVITMEESDA